MEFWLTEKHTTGYSVNWKFTDILFTDQTDYQHLAVINTLEFGKVLVLDGIIQTTEKDEFIYHEMIIHPSMMVHPNPQKALVIGGGDGGAIREIAKYPSISRIDLVEIDEKVIWASREYFPQISCALSDSRVRILIEDGLKFIKTKKNAYDIIIVDSSDPVGSAVELFGAEFYADIYNALKEDGIMVAQTESPQFNRELLAQVNKCLASLFPVTKTYLTTIASYIGGFWSFTVASKNYDPTKITPDELRVKSMKLKYYNNDIHKACFVLPNFVREIFE